MRDIKKKNKTKTTNLINKENGLVVARDGVGVGEMGEGGQKVKRKNMYYF